MIVLLLIVFGLVFGSFVNALVWRLHEKRNWVSERSECTHCHHTLAGKDLIPVVSWLLLRGKCRYCHKPIQDTPVSELTVPVLFVASYVWWPMELHGRGLFNFVIWLIMLVAFTALMLYDIKWFLLPDTIVWPIICLAVIQVVGGWLLFDHDWTQLVSPALGVVVISGTFYLLYTLSKGGWIGFGDVKLGIVLGLLAGTPLKAVLVLLVASLTGTIIALPLVVQGKAGRKSRLPFGPLLIFGMIIVQLFGTSITDWYMRILS